MKDERNLIIIVGQEGAGKSTTVRVLAPAIPASARLDAEDVGQVNPWQMNDAFMQLLWRNVADLTRNFWAAGYRNVVAGSFVSTIDDYTAFRRVLNMPANTWVIHLCADKQVRDVRRIERPKPSTAEWRDRIDLADPEDTTFAASGGDYRYLRIDNGGIDVAATVDRVRAWAPELFREN